MKVLFISKCTPYETTNGAEVKVKNLLLCMKEVSKVTCFFIIDAVNSNNTDDLLAKGDFGIVSRYRKHPVLRYLHHLKDVIILDKTTKDELHKVITRIKPDVIWLEFGYIGHAIPWLKKYGVPVCYGSHNSQWKLDYDIWRANGNPAAKLKMAPFVVLYWLQERLFMRQADRFFCISSHDLKYYSAHVSPDRLKVLPYFFDCRLLQGVRPFDADHPYVCMVGSLKSYQNFAAAVYLLEEVWPRIQSALHSLHLYVIGELPAEGSREYRQLIQVGEKFPTVVFTGKVATVISYVKGALMNLVPLTLGSGVRTKIIESAACRTPVVSTSIGAEGLPFENGSSILIADKPEAFADQVVNLVRDRDRRCEIAQRAFEVYHRELSVEAGTVALREIFAELENRDRQERVQDSSGAPGEGFRGQ